MAGEDERCSSLGTASHIMVLNCLLVPTMMLNPSICWQIIVHDAGRGSMLHSLGRS